jgi:hypothetical protein
MSVTGPDGAAKLLTSLDPVQILRLVEDVLFIRRHHAIRLTDGPGDGGRDIHSQTSRGLRHLTQSKWHADIAKTCSSSELGELPLAMIKFGYPEGLFVTNARISPQGKREYLDNYKDLALEFLDGEALAREVLGNALLQAVWLDDGMVRRIESAVYVPLAVRKHDTDRPVAPLRYFRECDPSPALAHLARRFPSLKFTIRPSMSDSAAFPRFRLSPVPSMEEMSSSSIAVSEVGIAGGWRLADLPDLVTEVCKAATTWLSDHFTAFTVRTGRPYISHIRESESGRGTFVLDDQHVAAYLVTPSSCGEETEWFAAEPHDAWTLRSDARVTEAPWIRLYSAGLDACLRYEIEAAVAPTYDDGMQGFRQVRRQGWRRSVFALVPKWTNWPYSIPEPDEKAEWPADGRILCGWFHWTLMGQWVSIPHESEDTDPSPFSHPNEAEEATRLASIRVALADAEGVELVAPTKARHMVAVVGHDPFDDTDTKRFHTGEVTSYFAKMIPSPVLPLFRVFALDVAWATQHPPGDVTEACRACAASCGLEVAGGWATFADGSFVVTSVDLQPSGLDRLPTSAVLTQLASSLAPWLACVESTLGASTRRQTKEYWKWKHGLTLTLHWSESLQPMAWLPQTNGTYEAIPGKHLGDDSGNPIVSDFPPYEPKQGG